uniref:Uncharacterized protein n=1 Tax=Arundo donax TaxID=35708 RepID=A0A0A9BBM8_ARUDO
MNNGQYICLVTCVVHILLYSIFIICSTEFTSDHVSI